MASRLLEKSYVSDDGFTYNLTLGRAKAAGSSLGAAVAGQADYPDHWTPRGMHGVSADGVHKSFMPCDAANTSYIGTGSTFTYLVNGTSVAFNVTGRTGEKRPNKAPLT